jgi:hypothetical protein
MVGYANGIAGARFARIRNVRTKDPGVTGMKTVCALARDTDRRLLIGKLVQDQNFGA